jgi:SAM-dependent methyltransferase
VHDKAPSQIQVVSDKPADVQRLGVPVIDYEGSGYRTDFWFNQGREYEDAVERIVVRDLLPPSGGRMVELGAGFGRLAGLYQGYEQVVLVDYSRTLLQQAVQQWGHDPRFVFVAGDLYRLPLASRVADALTMVRVMHHLADVPAALNQIRRVLHGASTAVLEYANKRHLKAILRWLTRRQSWSPFHPEPMEFVPLNFDFHPRWMDAHLRAAGLSSRRRLAVSHFRLSALKRALGPAMLARVERHLFVPGGRFPLSPSVFVQVVARDAGKAMDYDTSPGSEAGLFRCPRCGAEGLEPVDPDHLRCPDCTGSFKRVGGIWDFKGSPC